jgi:hypothetical protein
VTASHALSQLSYSPGEIEVVSKVNTCSLPASGRSNAEADLRAIDALRRGEQEAAVQRSGIHVEQIHLILAVGGPHIAVSPSDAIADPDKPQDELRS